MHTAVYSLPKCMTLHILQQHYNIPMWDEADGMGRDPGMDMEGWDEDWGSSTLIMVLTVSYQTE